MGDDERGFSFNDVVDVGGLSDGDGVGDAIDVEVGGYNIGDGPL